MNDKPGEMGRSLYRLVFRLKRDFHIRGHGRIACNEVRGNVVRLSPREPKEAYAERSVRNGQL